MSTATLNDNQSAVPVRTGWPGGCNPKSEIETALLKFIQAVEIADNLEIIGIATPNPEIQAPNSQDEAFVIRDHSRPEGIEGAYVEVSIQEIITRAGANGSSPIDTAQEFIDVITNARPPIVLQGMTRIVGYYSRTTNWNKSKVGELRDRSNGNYGLTGKTPLFQPDRLKAINAL